MEERRIKARKQIRNLKRMVTSRVVEKYSKILTLSMS